VVSIGSLLLSKGVDKTLLGVHVAGAMEPESPKTIINLFGRKKKRRTLLFSGQIKLCMFIV
jgi:hypothetical protein